LQEAFIKLNDDCHEWALAQTEVWRAEMLEHRNKIVEGIQQAIEEKIKPTIARKVFKSLRARRERAETRSRTRSIR
jgi:hypothetical protein